MSIDTERLKHDREYWDEVDPTQGHATHYDTKDDMGAPWMMLKDGHWFAYHFVPGSRHGAWYGPLNPRTDEWFKQEGWNDCVIRPVPVHEGFGMVKANDLIMCPPDSFDRPVCRHRDTGRYYCVLSEGITFEDIFAGRAELYYKGLDPEDEPSHPVTLQPGEHHLE